MKTFEQVLAENPTLHLGGFRTRSDEAEKFQDARAALEAHVDDFAFAVAWVDKNLTPATKLTTANRVGSYTLKHLAEPFAPRRYLANGVMVAALLACEFPSRQDYINLDVGIARRKTTLKRLDTERRGLWAHEWPHT